MSTGPVDPIGYQNACAATCRAHEPEPVTTNDAWCANASVGDCTKHCVEGLADLDAPCAECFIHHVEWQTAHGECGANDCVCTQNGPAFGGAACTEACASTLARHAQERLAAPEPEPIGHGPVQSIELGPRLLGTLSASDRYGLWGVSRNELGAMTLVQIELDGSVLLESLLPGEWRSDFDVYPSPSGVLVVGSDGHDTAVARFDRQAQLLWTTTLGSEAHIAGVSAAFGGSADLGGAAFAVHLGDSINYFDETGAQLDSRAVPQRSIAPYPEWPAYSLDPNGGIFMGETSDEDWKDPALVRHFPSQWLAGTAADHELQFSGSKIGGTVWDLQADASGGVYVLGSLHREQENLDFGDPFVSHLSAQGAADYTWSSDELISHWRNPDLAWNDAGELYLLTTEDPFENVQPRDFDTTGLCSVWGCSAFVLHKLSSTGRELWRYEHRKSSDGGSVSLSTTGAVVVTATIQREQTTGLLLVFSPG